MYYALLYNWSPYGYRQFLKGFVWKQSKRDQRTISFVSKFKTFYCFPFELFECVAIFFFNFREFNGLFLIHYNLEPGKKVLVSVLMANGESILDCYTRWSWINNCSSKYVIQLPKWSTYFQSVLLTLQTIEPLSLSWPIWN